MKIKKVFFQYFFNSFLTNQTFLCNDSFNCVRQAKVHSIKSNENQIKIKSNENQLLLTYPLPLKGADSGSAIVLLQHPLDSILYTNRTREEIAFFKQFLFFCLFTFTFPQKKNNRRKLHADATMQDNPPAPSSLKSLYFISCCVICADSNLSSVKTQENEKNEMKEKKERKKIYTVVST